MRGQVLAFDFRTGLGEISGDDGNRYKFLGSEWKPEAQPRPGQFVDFEIANDEALAIYHLPISNPSQQGVSKRVTAGLLGLLLGSLGIHKFYLGENRAGLIMLLVSVFGVILLFIPTMIMGIIALIEAITYLMMSDEDFERVYIEGSRPWF